MSVHLEKTFDVAAPPERVVDAIRNPELIEESERSRGAFEVKVTDGAKSDSSHEYEIFVVSPAKSATGIDKSKKEESRTKVRWDLGQKKGTWTWHGPHGPKVVVTGGYDVLAGNEGSKLRLYADIQIGIPIVGKVIEKKVKEGFESNWPNYVGLVRKFSTQ